MILSGIGASEGLGLGNAVCIRENRLDYTSVVYTGAEAEKARLLEAIATFSIQTEQMVKQMDGQVGSHEAEILSGHVAMLEDPFLRAQMEEKMQQGCVAEQAVDEVCAGYEELFSQVDDELVRQRAADIRDIRDRLLMILLHVENRDLASLPTHSVLVASDLTPSMTVGLRSENVSAIVTQTGGRTSHSAILARALGIPAVLSVPEVMDHIQEGQQILVNGTSGEIIVEPTPSQVEDYRRQSAKMFRQRQKLEKYRESPTRDADGRLYKLYANIGTPEQARYACEAGAEGIGLFRTEFLFMDRTSAPDEEEQYQAYQAVSDAMPEKEVLIRTLDIGGDKEVPYLSMGREENPFLGYRAIRYCLDRPDFFAVQLRALLRAGAKNKNIQIMLPLVTSVEEVRAARVLVNQCKEELRSRKMDFDDSMRIGIMMETPAAVQIADLLALEADFFSIGTNDLTQYTLAVDRGNAKVESLYHPLHPAVLRSIQSVITAAQKAHIPVGMCGEAAADPRLIPLLLAWGLDEFSVSTSELLKVRYSISQWSGAQVKKLSDEVMGLDCVQKIEDTLKKEI